MAKIRNSNPKQSSGSYERLVGNKAMASIFTKAQSTVITNGTELEKIISNHANKIDDLNSFVRKFDKETVANGSYLCTKNVLKKSCYNLEKHEPDFLAFTINDSQKLCYVVELKDGDSFDTKKSLVEKKSLILFVNHIAPKIPFRINHYVCCFNQSDKNRIITGFKNVFTKDEVITGKEFCDILGINYDAIVALRSADAADNFRYVVDKMFEIQKVRTEFAKNYRIHLPQNDFYETDGIADEDTD